MELQEQKLSAQDYMEVIPKKEIGMIMVPDWLKEKEFIERRTGKVYLKPIRGDKFNSFNIRGYKVKGTNLYMGIPTGEVDQHGKPRFKRILVTAFREYDLSILNDRIEWEVVRMHEAIKGSPFEGGNAVLEIHDSKKEAKIKNEKIMESVQAVTLAAKLEGDKLNDFCRIIEEGKFRPDLDEPFITKNVVIQYAQENPHKFMQMYNDSRRIYREVLFRAEQMHIIKYRIDKGYSYRDSMPLGNTRESIINRMEEDKTFFEMLNRESRDEEKVTKKGKSILSTSDDNRAMDELIQKKREQRLKDMEEQEKEMELLIAKRKEELEAIESKVDNLKNDSDFEFPETSIKNGKADKENDIPKKETDFDININSFMGRKINGQEPSVWKMKELIELALSSGVTEEELEGKKSKMDVVKLISKHKNKNGF